MAWNDLTLPDKARMIKLAVDSGITDLRTIQEVYNKYAEGGDLPPTFEEYYASISKEKADTTNYNLRRAYEIAPKEQLEAFRDNPEVHLYSSYPNDIGDYEMLKFPLHPTILNELVEYNSNRDFNSRYRYTGDGYVPRYGFTANHYDGGGDLLKKLKDTRKERIKKDYTDISTPYYTPPSRPDVQVPNRYVKVSDDDLVKAYTDNVLWVMENPKNKGYNPEDGLYYAYEDRDADGNVHLNIGPGLESNGHPNIDYSIGHTREELDKFAEKTVRNRVEGVTKSLQNMQEGKYYTTRDTLSMGPLLSLVDIAYNAKTANRKNMPEKWPALVENLATGNLEKARQETYSGSKRRQLMRNDLLTYKPITKNTVRNR